MPLYQKKTDEGALLGIWQIRETENELKDLLYDASVYEEQLQVFSNEKRRLEFLAVRVLIRELTGGQKCVGYEASGKPYLLDRSYQISISHTAGYAAVILHPHRPVAIDIERRSDRVMRVKEKFMNERELAGTDPLHPLCYTLICWSAKETLFKISNISEVDFRTHLHLTPFPVCERGCFRARETRISYPVDDMIEYELQPEFVLTWCIR